MIFSLPNKKVEKSKLAGEKKLFHLFKNNQITGKQTNTATSGTGFITSHEMQKFLQKWYHDNINKVRVQYELLIFNYEFKNTPNIIGCFENLLHQI